MSNDTHHEHQCWANGLHPIPKLGSSNWSLFLSTNCRHPLSSPNTEYWLLCGGTNNLLLHNSSAYLTIMSCKNILQTLVLAKQAATSVHKKNICLQPPPPPPPPPPVHFLLSSAQPPVQVPGLQAPNQNRRGEKMKKYIYICMYVCMYVCMYA